MQQNNSPFFSVIIPVYNVKEYLKECVDSILSQSYGDYEIILIDDGSNDGSEIICDHYSESYSNAFVIHKENGGQSSARNRGVELANGRYFIFVDSDDYIASDTLEVFKKKIDDIGDPDVILSDRMFNVEPDGAVVDVQRHLVLSDYEGISGKQAILKMGMEWSPCGKCYRTDYWKDKGFRFTEGRISEDFQLMDRVTLEADKVAMVPAHYYYRWKIRSSTMHVNYGKLVEDTIFVVEDWNSYLQAKNYDKELDDLIRRTLAYMLEHTAMGNAYYADRHTRNMLFDRLSNCREYIKYDRSAEGRLILAAVSIFGIRNTCFFLNRIKSLRKKMQGKV